MHRLHLDTLPEELISHIASSTNATTVLNLTRTCHRLRSVCSDALIFNRIIRTSQQERRPQSSSQHLDFDALSSRAGKDVSLWARYAVADQRAWEAEGQDVLSEGSWEWAPELAVLRHPFVRFGCWGRLDKGLGEVSAREMFCFAVAVLAREDPMPQLTKHLSLGDEQFMASDDTLTSYLWSFCSMILEVRQLIHSRNAARPHLPPARFADMFAPSIDQLSFLPLNAHYSLPVPFTSTWDEWYQTHTRKMVFSPTHLYTGHWRGYYTYHWDSTHDPPMTDIRFQRREEDSPNGDIVEVHAEDCLDGVDRFNVTGRFSFCDDSYTFRGLKVYRHGTRWEWRLKMTPLGLVGFWGGSGRPMRRHGMVWLWKCEEER